VTTDEINELRRKRIELCRHVGFFPDRRLRNPIIP
jgi:hypothetical protein